MTIAPIQSTERAQVIAPAVAAQATQAFPQAADPASAGSYFSPKLIIDPQTQSVVLEYLNPQTGAVINQYPSEKELKAYASQQKFTDLEVEPNPLKISQATNQPVPTAVVDQNAVKPVATASKQELTGKSTSQNTPGETGSSVIV